AVGPHHAEDLAGHHFERHAVHGQDGAVRLPEPAHLQHRPAHDCTPSCAAAAARVADASFACRRALRRSGMLSNPSGSHSISTTTATPNTNRYQACAKRSHSGSSTPTAEPSSGPKKYPGPPTTTIRYIMNDV